MKNILFVTLLSVLLSGCFGEPKFNASNEISIKESTSKIADTMSVTDKASLQKAIEYFSVGGTKGLKAMTGAAFFGTNSFDALTTLTIMNLKLIDGLTGQEILNKYRQQSAEDMAELLLEEELKKLASEASLLLKDNKFEEALTKYKEMSNYSSGIKASEVGIAKTTEEMHDFTEQMNYIDKIKITEFIATRISTYSKKDVPAIRVGLKNTGDRSLDKIQVTVYFQDENGNTIFEKDYYPVLVSAYSTSNKPLKAGYVSEMEKDTYYTLDSPLTEWKTGKAVLKITEIKFSN